VQQFLAYNFFGYSFRIFSTDSSSASKFALYDTHYQIFAKKDLPTPRRLSGRTFGDSPATDKNSACIRGTPEGSAAFFYFLKMNDCVKRNICSKTYLLLT
jgi:hypothetical protein